MSTTFSNSWLKRRGHGDWKASHPHGYFGRHSREAALPRTVICQAAVVLMLWGVVRALTADACATPLERVEFESASQRLLSGKVIPGDRIQGDLAKPDSAGPYPAVIGLHGCAGMHDTTKQRLANDLVAWGYVVLLVDSYATRRGVDDACTSSAFATFLRRRPDAYGALVFLARQTFVDPHRVAGGLRKARGYPFWAEPCVRGSSHKQFAVRAAAASILHPGGGGASGIQRSSLGPSTLGRRQMSNL